MWRRMQRTPAAPETPGDEENPFERQYGDWKSRTPVLCRLLAQGLVVSYLLSWVVDLQFLFGNIIGKTLYRGQLWRLVTSPAVGNSLLGSLLAAVIVGDGVGPRLERAGGTASFGLSLLAATLVVNVTFVVCCFGLEQLGGGHAYFVDHYVRHPHAESEEPPVVTVRDAMTSGVWPLVLYLVAVEGLNSPEASRRLFFMDIPKTYYPLAIFGFMTLLGGLRLDLALGLGTGYAEVYGYISLTSAAIVTRLERIPYLTTDSNFVTAHRALGSGAWAPSLETPASGSSSRGFATVVMDALRQARGSASQEDDDDLHPSSESRKTIFPQSGGHVLGSSPTAGSTSSRVVVGPALATEVPSVQAPASPSQTAAANRATILAAAEKRARGS